MHIPEVVLFWCLFIKNVSVMKKKQKIKNTTKTFEQLFPVWRETQPLQHKHMHIYSKIDLSILLFRPMVISSYTKQKTFSNQGILKNLNFSLSSNSYSRNKFNPCYYTNTPFLYAHERGYRNGTLGLNRLRCNNSVW